MQCVYTSYEHLLWEVQYNGDAVESSNISTNRSFEAKELNNVQLLLHPFKQFLLNEDEVKYYEKELQWYFDTYERPIKKVVDLTHEKWSEHPVYSPDVFVKELRQMAEDVLGAKNRCGPNSNYGEMCLRLKNHANLTQFEWVVNKLLKDKYSRQAIAFYNSPNYQYYSNDDFVCCLSQLFNIKDNKLNTVIYSRSNDLINGFRFDSIWWRIFQCKVLAELKKTYPTLELGYMLVNMFSAHYYLKDEDKIGMILDTSTANAFLNISEEYFL